MLLLDGTKLRWHKDRVDAWLNWERIAPITIDCALTRRCNYKCIYCYGQFQKNKEKKLTQDIIYRFLDDCADIGVKAISFVSDGESTCSPYLYDAVNRGYDNGLDMALGTNGVLLKEDKLEDLLKRLTYIRFNISGAEEFYYTQIMGCKSEDYKRVIQIIKQCIEIKNKKKLKVTIGLQMVLIPHYFHQIIPIVKLGQELGVDYTVIKHCSDDEKGSLGINYSDYFKLKDILREAETYTSDDYLVKAKWTKIMSDGVRSYNRCYGSQFIMQLSGSGLVAPCGMLFNDKFKEYHIGNIAETSFKTLWKSERYWEVMRKLGDGTLNISQTCGTHCLQNSVNEYLFQLKAQKPEHINFI